MKFIHKTLIIVLFHSSILLGQVSGLSGWNIFLDPGHSRRENMGVYGYSEAERNLRVALRLRDLLLTNTDIDTVFISRTDDQQSVSLSQRTDYANSVGAAWFHSIHSDASSSPQVGSTLLLWGQTYDGNEKIPNGGKAMSDIIVDILTRGMRADTRGSLGDCGFYSPWTTPCTSSWPGPWLHVNRNTIMPSELSESGFHTNPIQNQRFMNAEWKQLEAMTFYWSILQFFGIQRPVIGICTGIVSDWDSGIPVNGARVSLAGQAYTTDTFESLFFKYTNDSDKLHNGFYYLENIPSGMHQMIVEADGYYSDTMEVVIVDTFFTFTDVQLISDRPPFVTTTTPAAGDTHVSIWNDILIQFNRRMNQASVEAAFGMIPETGEQFDWEDDGKRLRFKSDSLNFKTNYMITISGDARDLHNHLLDGDGDGIGGDAFTLNFVTRPSDISPPQLVSLYPPIIAKNIEAHPIINVVFNEPIDPASITEETITLERFQGNVLVPGKLMHYDAHNQSILSLFPDHKLLSGEVYMIKIHPGYKDLFGNKVEDQIFSSFQTSDADIVITSIDYFETELTDHWWGAQQSGSTTGIITEKTSRLENTDIVNLLTGSTTSLQVDYGWDLKAPSWLMRIYLGSGAPRNVTFDNDYMLQVYIFGDGSDNLFRFCVDDHVPAAGASNHEVSRWFPIDWLGWRLVSWDMKADSTGIWLGDGQLDGTLRFDSIQLTYQQGSPSEGTLIFDDLRVVKEVPMSRVAEESKVPQSFVLHQNYPNPFNSETTIKYRLSEMSSPVILEIYDLLGKRIRTLVDEEQSDGEYLIRWDGKDGSGKMVASGNYIYQLSAGKFIRAKRMIIIR